MRLIFLDILRFVVDIKDVGVDAAAFFFSCNKQVCSTLVDANYSLRGCIISSARQGNQCLLWFASFVTEIKVLELRKTSSGQWQQPIYTTVLQLILIIPSIRSISSAPARCPAPLRLVMPFLLRHFRSHHSTTCYLSPEYRELSGGAL